MMDIVLKQIQDNYCQACGAIMENNGDDDDE